MDQVAEGYAFSKEAIIVWTQFMGAQLIKKGIRINCSLPSPTQTPMMAIDRQDFARSEAFWLLLLKDGKAVAGAGAKYVDLEDEPIETYLQRTSRGQYGRDSDPLLSVSRPVRDYVRGRLIYLGELEFHPDHRGNKDLLEAFVKVLQGLAAVKWRNFDWMYVFIDEDHLRFAHIYDFQITVRDAITWAEPVPAGRLPWSARPVRPE